jgi:hypothetical protein
MHPEYENLHCQSGILGPPSTKSVSWAWNPRLNSVQSPQPFAPLDNPCLAIMKFQSFGP